LQIKEKKNNVYKNRPPNVWNEPESIQKDHFLRCSADPFTIYKDDRVRELHEYVEYFG
jgi:L-rhamnose mutarotase